MKKRLSNPFLELEIIEEKRFYLLGLNYSKGLADRLAKKCKKKTNKFCEKHKGFYKCSKCNGVGFLNRPFMIIDDFMEKNDYVVKVAFERCSACGLTGVITWLDKMIGGWKSV